MQEKVVIARALGIDSELSLGAIRAEYEVFAERIRPMVCDTSVLLNNAAELLALLPELPLDQKEKESNTALEQMLNSDMSPEECDAYRQKQWAILNAWGRKLDAIATAEVRAKTTTWKPPTPKERTPMLKSYRHHEFAKMKVLPYYLWVNGGASYHCTIHPLEIDWTLTETELMQA